MADSLTRLWKWVVLILFSCGVVRVLLLKADGLCLSTLSKAGYRREDG
jgi:hypothetical protein